MGGTMRCVLAAVTAFTAACATQDEIPSLAEILQTNLNQNGRACVRVSDIQGYGVPQGGLLHIDSMREYYIASVLPGCFDLETAPRLAFRGEFNEICGGRQDKIHTGENQCVIHQLFEFDSREQAQSAYQNALQQRQQMQSQK